MAKKTSDKKEEPKKEKRYFENPGRMSDYDIKLAEKICRELSTTHFGLKRICAENPDFPHPRTIYTWLIRHPEFKQMYEDAKKQQCTVMAEEILEVAWDDSKDNVEREQGTSCNAEWISRSRLKVDSLKWLLTKLEPRKYGDRTESLVTLTTQESALKELKKSYDVS